MKKKRGERGSWVVIAGLLLASSACSYGIGPAGNYETMQSSNQTVYLDITNDYGFPLKVYAVGSGITHRLGTVYPGLASRFALPPAMIGNGSVELFARADDGRPAIRSGPLLLAHGRVVDFKVTRHLALSSATIRP